MSPLNRWLVAFTVSQLCSPIQSFITPVILNNNNIATCPSITSYRERSMALQMVCSSKSAGKEEEKDVKTSEKVPITLLSGFLGAGKTTTLQHLLENVEGTRIGVIVNDVASINIDAKLITGKKEGVVELQNGCACCSLSNELLASVDQLLGNAHKFDALVVEMSGVADPISIQTNWKNAKVEGNPVVEKAEIAQVVTLVDSTTFGTDWMTWDTAGDREKWSSQSSSDCGQTKKVPELLAEQIEAANVIVLNKKDLAGPEQLEVASSLARSLNAKAKIITAEYGKVKPSDILQELAVPKESGCCSSGTSDKESKFEEKASCSSKAKKEAIDSFKAATKEPNCCEKAAAEGSSCRDHDHSKDAAPANNDGACLMSSDNNKIGVTSFVYKADRPFQTVKLLSLLEQWPVPIKDDLDLSLLKEAQERDYEVQSKDQEDSPFLGVLRSKGFCWFAPTRWSGPKEDVWRHDAAMYWSHAGKQFGITRAGQWWGTVGREEMKERLAGDPEECNRILEEDFVTEEFADRRQEIVFIGIGMDEEEIRRSLDDCLMKDKGMKRYREYLSYTQDGVLL
ncbi:unnamed protein product [Cylindrotheca closterium]|uniref:CobW C-terminal domain-containing protein n=1 Tax=Cylindrotheca closterium TaxID=2856 RepID=A0AAD2FIC5_9STRA|nr:unnamed protein product [Cylindrotheca closterium]